MLMHIMRCVYLLFLLPVVLAQNYSYFNCSGTINLGLILPDATANTSVKSTAIVYDLRDPLTSLEGIDTVGICGEWVVNPLLMQFANFSFSTLTLAQVDSMVDMIRCYAGLLEDNASITYDETMTLYCNSTTRAGFEEFVIDGGDYYDFDFPVILRSNTITAPFACFSFSFPFVTVSDDFDDPPAIDSSYYNLFEFSAQFQCANTRAREVQQLPTCTGALSTTTLYPFDDDTLLGMTITNDATHSMTFGTCKEAAILPSSLAYMAGFPDPFILTPTIRATFAALLACATSEDTYIIEETTLLAPNHTCDDAFRSILASQPTQYGHGHILTNISTNCTSIGTQASTTFLCAEKISTSSGLSDEAIAAIVLGSLAGLTALAVVAWKRHTNNVKPTGSLYDLL